MNYNYILFTDFETGSKRGCRTQPIQLTSVAIDARKLEIVEKGVFNTYIKPYFLKEECDLYGLDELEEEALKHNKIDLETLEKAPILKVIWPQFIDFVNQFNKKKTRWTAPIIAGYNNNGFDDTIIQRITGGNNRFNECKKEPWKYGPWDDEYQKDALFHPRDNIDMMKYVWYWFENDYDTKSISFDSIREKVGMSKDGAHNALVDCIQGSKFLIKMLKLARNMYPKVKFTDSFKNENEEITQLVEKYKNN